MGSINTAPDLTRAPLQESSGNLKHLPALDGLRAIAILLVIPHNLDFLTQPIPLSAQPIAAVMHMGWIGVQLFFVLSGFLITGNLLDTQRSENYYRAFFGRRILRIFPLYYAVMLLAFVLLPLLNIAPGELRASQHNQIWLWTFLSNWAQPYGHTVSGFSHFWSLAIEEQFYLLWPFIMRRSSASSVLILCLCISAAALIIRWAILVTPVPDDAIYLFTLCRMDALACGAAAAALFRLPMRSTSLARVVNRCAAIMLVLLIAGAGFTRGYFVNDERCQIWGYSLLSLAFATFVYAGAVESFKGAALLWRALISRPMRLIARYSYGMYIFHLPLHVFVGGPLIKHLFPHINAYGTLAYIAVMVLVTFLTAALTYEVFESRFLRLKRLFVPGTPAVQQNLVA